MGVVKILFTRERERERERAEGKEEKGWGSYFLEESWGVVMVPT